MKLPFSKKTNPAAASKRQAVIFVDFDHWYVSLKSLFRIEESVKRLIETESAKYDVTELYVYGDFSGQSRWLGELAVMTENIFDLQGDRKRDKDILMLDQIYRTGVRYKGTDTTVIFVSGSGHLTLSARFLKEECGIKVGVYSVRGALSGSLKETVNWAVELPNDEYISMLFPLIIKNCVHVSENDITSTFKTTVDAVSNFNDVSPVLIEEAVRKMLDIGYLYQKQTVLRSLDTIRVICANWEMMIKDGLYDPEKM